MNFKLIGGDLHYHLSQHGVFSEKEVKFYAAEIILGLEHMHLRSIVYRDLKVIDFSYICRIMNENLFFKIIISFSLQIFYWMSMVMFVYLIWV